MFKFLSYSKKRKTSRNSDLLSLATRHLSLTFAVPTTRCHLLSLVVIRYHSMYHSSVFFINNRARPVYFLQMCKQMFCKRSKTFKQNHWKIPKKKFIFNKATGFKSEFIRTHFLRPLLKVILFMTFERTVTINRNCY